MSVLIRRAIADSQFTNLREAPNTRSKIRGKLGQTWIEADLLGERQTNDFLWLNIRINGEAVWVVKSLVSIKESGAILPRDMPLRALWLDAQFPHSTRHEGVILALLELKGKAVEWTEEQGFIIPYPQTRLLQWAALVYANGDCLMLMFREGLNEKRVPQNEFYVFLTDNTQWSKADYQTTPKSPHITLGVFHLERESYERVLASLKADSWYG